MFVWNVRSGRKTVNVFFGYLFVPLTSTTFSVDFSGTTGMKCLSHRSVTISDLFSTELQGQVFCCSFTDCNDCTTSQTKPTDDDCEHIWCLFLCFRYGILNAKFVSFFWSIFNFVLFSQLTWCASHFGIFQFFHILMQSNCVLFECLDFVNFLFELASDSISLGNPCQGSRLDLVHLLLEPALDLWEWSTINGSIGSNLHLTAAVSVEWGMQKNLSAKRPSSLYT